MTHRHAYDFAPDTTNWRDRATCRDHDPELFWPVGKGAATDAQTAAAKAVCAGCPVRPDCRRWALDHDIRDGVWGGLSEDELQAAGEAHRTPPGVADLITRIRSMAGRGYTDPEIGAALALHRATVQRYRRRHRIPAGQAPSSSPPIRSLPEEAVS